MVRQRREVQEGVEQQEQQQRQNERQAPVVGDQHVVAASLQEGGPLGSRLHPGRHDRDVPRVTSSCRSPRRPRGRRSEVNRGLTSLTRKPELCSVQLSFLLL